MDLERMLDKCVKGQWDISDLDWTVAPRPMSREEEISIVQYFTNMEGIERLAGALFAEQREIADDPTLKKIFATFIADEERHAQVAARLARHYDVHHYQTYELSPELVRFRPYFLEAIRLVSPEVANIYITSGELMLDVALLRSLNDYVDDDMSKQAMELINRDESRHIAMDYYMMEYYASDEYQSRPREQVSKSARERARSAWVFANVLYHARPFTLAVFLNPMTLLDADGKRMREAFKRMQLLSQKPKIVRRPFPRFLHSLQVAYDQPVIRTVFGGILSRLGGAPGEYMQTLYSEDEAERARGMSMEEMARDSVAAKYKH